MKKLTLNTKLICILVMIATVLSSFTGCAETIEFFLTEDSYTDEYYLDDTIQEYTEQTDEQTQISETTSETTASETSIPEDSETETVTESSIEQLSVEKDGRYTTPEDVAEYIHTFGTLPSNFITKKEAQKLGWNNKEGNLWDVTDQMSIGGDYFGNYEGLLPEADGRKYTECDVNYEGGYRGGERIVFSNDGLIFYTDDHYESFTQLY